MGSLPSNQILRRKLACLPQSPVVKVKARDGDALPLKIHLPTRFCVNIKAKSSAIKKLTNSGSNINYPKSQWSWCNLENVGMALV